MNIEETREQFRYLNSGKIYFNHAAISPLPTVVKNKLNEYLNIRSDTDIEPYFKTLPQAKGAKSKLAKMLGVDSNQIAWSSNVSNSLNVLAQGISWKSGDEIIINNLEFPSNVYPFLNLKKEGVNILFANDEDGKVDYPQIERLITPKTKLISISMVQFLTGYRANLMAIGDLCKKYGILFCVDGIQGAGIVQVNLKDCNIDFFAGGSHKWLMGLQGLGYFYISPKLFEIINQRNVGWTSVKNTWDLLKYDLSLLENADKFQTGTLPRLAIIALDASLSLFEEVGYENIENQIILNSNYLIESLLSKGYKPILTEVPKDNLAGIVSFIHSNSAEIVEKLEKKDIICTVREGMVRISPHFYNTTKEIDVLIKELL